MIVVAGLPMHHYRGDDAVAEAYAMVLLAESGFAQQTEVARAFARSVRSLRRYQRRYAGMAALGRAEGWCRGRRWIPGRHLRSIEMLKSQGDEQSGDRAPAGGQREGDPQAGRPFEAGRRRTARARWDHDRGGGWTPGGWRAVCPVEGR
jgi:hypothetical protein